VSTYARTDRTKLRRLPVRGTYDHEAVHAILDEALVCQLGFAVDGQPFVLPTTFVRDAETLFVHGSAAGRMTRVIAGGLPVCLSVTLLDGLVLARSAFHHSVNYRSVVVLGTAREVVDTAAKRHALGRLIEKVSPGRAAHVRAPDDKELRVTSVLEIPLEEVSAKIRTGDPLDDAGDMDLPVWAGVVPLELRAAAPVAHGTSGVHSPPAVPFRRAY
jgi:nitroimidazol reductase NimA-like FMN-containing flavoprotein (pyridoxamine 5'-phosphate oxidase superfamily)